MTPRLKRARGTTLIETLIYSALLAIFIGATFAFVASVIGSTDTLLERNEVVTALEFIEQKLAWFSFHAASVAAPAPGTSGTTLMFRGSDVTLFPATFSLATGTVTLALPGVPATPLANARVGISSFGIEHFSTAQGSSTLRVTLEARSVLYPHLLSSSTTHYVLP